MDAAAQPHFAPGRVVEILDRTFRVYRENFALFIGLVAVLLVPLNALQFAITAYLAENNPEFVYDDNQGYTYDYDYYYNDTPFYYDLIPPVFNLLIFGLQIVFIYSVISYVTSEHYLGRKATVWEAIDAVKGRWLPLGAALLLIVVIGLPISAVFAIGAVCFFPLLGFIVVFYLLWNMLAFLVPVLVLEKVGVWRGMTRALGLAKSRWWAVFWFFMSILLIYGLVLMVLMSVGTMLVGAGGSSFFEFAYSSNTSTGFLILQMIIYTLISVVMLPIIPTGMTLLYYDTRIRLEGLDLALQLVPTPDPRPSDIPSPSLGVPFLSGSDIVNMVLLLVGTVGICSAVGGFFYLTLVLFAG